MVAIREIKPWRNFRLDSSVQRDDAGNPRSWIMLMPEGVFEHPQFGKLEFTPAKLAEFKRNFDQRTRKIDIALDQDHDAGKATGWLERLEIRPATADMPAGLWGLVAWTRLGVELLHDRIYGYFSPEFGDYEDEETGKVFHNVIIGGALTNRPYLKVMPAVQLSEITLADGVSTKSWASVNKSKLPRSSFLVQGDPDDKSTWKLPIYEGAGAVDADGHYTKRGALNINAVRAALAAIGGARSGTPMSVPGSVKSRLQNLLKRYGGGSGGGTASSKAAEGGDMTTYRLMGPSATSPKSPVPDGDDEPPFGRESVTMSGRRKAADPGAPLEPDFDGERLDDLDTDGNDETMDDGDGTDGDGFDPESNTHGAASTDGHMHGKYGSHSHDGDADHSDAPIKGSSRKASAKKASDVYSMSEHALRAEVARLREQDEIRAAELRQANFKLYEREVGEILEGWRANTFQFSEGTAKKSGRITTSRVFDQKYRAYMLSDGVRLSEGQRKKLNELIETALSAGIVDLTERGTSFDQEARRTIRQGGAASSSMRFDEADALEDEASKIALSEYKKPIAQLDFPTQLEIRMRAEKVVGYTGQHKIAR